MITNGINTNDINSTYYVSTLKEGKLINSCEKCGLPIHTSRFDGLCWHCYIGVKK